MKKIILILCLISLSGCASIMPKNKNSVKLTPGREYSNGKCTASFGINGKKVAVFTHNNNSHGSRLVTCPGNDIFSDNVAVSCTEKEASITFTGECNNFLGF